MAMTRVPKSYYKTAEQLRVAGMFRMKFRMPTGRPKAK